MASEGRTHADAVALLERIRQAPGKYDFFQALRRIECAFRDRPRLGQARHAKEEPIRLSQEPICSFVSRPFSGVEMDGKGPPRIVTHFLGLFGPNGPLPIHLTEYARDRLRNAGDVSMVRFVDMFHHRLLSLFYRAYANAEPTVSRDRPATDRFQTYVGSVCGVGMPSFLERDAMPDRAKLFYAGRLGARPRNASGLRDIINDFFGVPTEIEEFVGEWIEVPKTSRWRLGQGALGRSTLGSRAWVCQGKFRIVIGPVSHERFQEMLPGTESFERLESIVRNYAGDQLAWDVRMIVDKESRKPWCLGRSRLGWSSLLGASRTSHASVILKPQQQQT